MSVRKTAKHMVKRAFLASGTLRLANRLSSPSVVIFRYHSIQERPEDFDSTIGCDSIHATSIFERQMELLAQRFTPVSMDDVLHFLKGGKSLPPRAVAVTFDDGYKDNFRFAAPVLNRYGVPGTFYVLVDSVDRSRAPWYCRLRHAFLTSRNRTWHEQGAAPCDLTTPKDRFAAFTAAAGLCAKSDAATREQYIRDAESALDPQPFPAESDLMMNWDEARTLAKSGHIVGAHTMTHPNMAYVSAEDARRELADSKSKLEKELGRPVLHFSYPHPALRPQWNQTTLNLTIELGYSTAVTTTSGAVRAGANPFTLPRTYVPREEPEFLWHTERTLLQRSHSSAPDYPGM